MVRYKEKCRKLRFKNYKYKQKQYYKDLLQEIVVSRQVLLDKAYNHSLDFKTCRKPQPLVVPNSSTNINARVRRKYEKIMKDIHTECGEEGALSSDDEYLQTVEPVATKLSQDEVDRMLDRHRRRRLLCGSH